MSSHICCHLNSSLCHALSVHSLIRGSILKGFGARKKCVCGGGGGIKLEDIGPWGDNISDLPATQFLVLGYLIPISGCQGLLYTDT